MKLISWNVNGIRAIVKKDFFQQVKEIDADILCLQETKAQDNQVVETLEAELGQYQLYTHSAIRKGYSGTAVLSKKPALSVSYGIGIEEHDQEGRVITAEYDDFFLVNVYVPNSGSELARLEYRQTWDLAFFNYLKKLEETKPVIMCGDLNVAHTEIDLARPKANYNKSAGYMQEEIDGMDRLVQGGFIDSFRFIHPDQKDAYSWWSYRGGARAKNVGWRIDYFILSPTLTNQLKDAFILPQMEGSDHCPVGITIS